MKSAKQRLYVEPFQWFGETSDKRNSIGHQHIGLAFLLVKRSLTDIPARQ